ncbi:ribonuclease H-like domain-containing protein, partial [Tanacetum coccineum]
YVAKQGLQLYSDALQSQSRQIEGFEADAIKVEGLYFDPSGYAWCYTYTYIQDGVTFIAKRDVDSKTHMAVIWNPTIRKSVSIVIPIPKARHIVGFGVCPDTSDPKLVKITDDKISWVVEVFTLSTRVWKTVYTGAPFKLCALTWMQAFVNGVIYFHAIDFDFVNQVMSSFIISYDLKSEKFGEVCLPERLVHTPDLIVTKVNESLGLLEYYDEGDMKVCGVWTRKDGANN